MNENIIERVSGTSYQPRIANPVPGYAANVNANTGAGKGAVSGGSFLIDKLKKEHPLVQLIEAYFAMLGISEGPPEGTKEAEDAKDAWMAGQYEQYVSSLPDPSFRPVSFEEYKHQVYPSYVERSQAGRDRVRFVKEMTLRSAAGGLGVGN